MGSPGLPRSSFQLPQFLRLVLLILLSVLVIMPLGMLLIGSFRDAPPGAENGGWTVDGWRSAYTDVRTYTTLGSTLLVTLASVALATPVALFLAWVVTRTDTPGRRLLEPLLIAPLFVPGVLVALSWTVLGSPRTGLMNRAVRIVPGLESFTFNIYSWYGLILLFALAITPLMYFMMLPPMKTLDHTLEEAAAASGAGRLQTAVRISLPLAAPAILGGAILVAIKAIENLEVPAIVRGGSGIDVFMTRIFFSIRLSPSPDYAQGAALGAVVVLITALLVLLQARYLSRRDFTTIGGRGLKTDPTRLGPWRFVTAGCCWLYLGFTIVLPLGVLLLGSFERTFGLGRWDLLTLDNWRSVGDDDFQDALWNTVFTAGVASVLVTLLSACVGYCIVRSSGPTKWSFEAMSWIPWALPGLVLGLALLWGYALVPGRFYLSRWVLVVAYVTILLPLGVRLFTAAFRQLNPELEQAASAAGSGPLRRIAVIIAPLVAHTITASLVLSFVLSVREVAMPAILANRDTQVLGSFVLNSWFQGQASLAAVSGVVMIGLCVAALLLQILTDRVLLGRRQERSTASLQDTES